MKKIVLFVAGWCAFVSAEAQTDPVIEKINQKLAQVNDYVADAVIKTNVAFIKAASGKVRIYYKKPDSLKIKKESGISLLPRNTISLTMNTVLNVKNYTALQAGWEQVNGRKLQVIKLIPAEERVDWVLSTVWVDPQELLIYKMATTTRDNGSYEMQLRYGAYAKYGLADHVVFTFNTKDYKLPNGVTLEFGQDPLPPGQKSMQSNKGSVEIHYEKYTINKGLPASF